MIRVLSAAVAGVFLHVSATEVQAQVGPRDKWVLLGTRVVNLVADRDVVDVTAARGQFKAIRLQAQRSGILLDRVEVQYGNCAVHREERRINLNVGERTRPIDLKGASRVIDEVRLFYRTAPGTLLPAQVEVWGLQSPAGARLARPGSAARCPQSGAPVAQPLPQPLPTTPTRPTPATAEPGNLTAGGEVLFGVEYVGLGTDRDVIRVGRERGKFDRLRLRILDADVHITELKVVYADREPETLAVNSTVKRNSRTGWLDLQGSRFIREIQLLYRAEAGSTRRARVEVYGEFADGWYGAGSGTGGYSAANAGWLFLGAQSPLFVSIRQGIGYQNDVVSVARNRGFKSMRIDVKDRAITLNQLIIDYNDGKSQVIDARARVGAGASYGPLTLRPQPIKEIRVSYRSRLIDKEAKGRGHAFVEFWVR